MIALLRMSLTSYPIFLGNIWKARDDWTDTLCIGYFFKRLASPENGHLIGPFRKQDDCESAAQRQYDSDFGTHH